MSSRWSLPAILFATLLAGCASPPNKEMDQAQGAIDAAKAVGAERYAPAEYQAAIDALRRSHEAVEQNDYRLALNHALDSRERAQNAARQAADTKAQIRSEVERTMAEVSGLTLQAQSRLEAARKARVPSRALAGPAQTLASIKGNVQKAGELVKQGDYLAAQPVLKDVKSRLEKAIAAIDAAAAPPAARRRR